MRSFYEMEKDAPPDGPVASPAVDGAVRLFLQLAVIAFWTPCAAIDLYLLWKGGGREGANAFVFWLLFRQALVFLTLWFTVALAQGLLVGRRTPAEPRRKRRRLAPEDIHTAASAGVALTRGNRGI